MKKIIQLKSAFAIAIVFCLIFSGKAFGSHTMGADLTYQCLGGNTYKITVSFYRDCIGIAAPTNPYVTINSTTCAQSLGVTCYPRAGTGVEVTPKCSSAVTTCGGGAFTGIQEWIYDGIITLPANCTDWVFGYSLCCRNAAITTITTPSSSTFYIYATLNNSVTSCNSSPTFSNKPVPFLCVGQQFCFNHGAYDADGDSLVYSLITPKQTSSSTVNYIAPYNAANPLNSSPATTFNSASGDICLTPQALEVTVIAVLVSEYRNGVLIGTVERDLQMTVMNCANNLPSLSGINGTNNFSITLCANQQTCFDIFSNDPDAGQQLVVDWNYGVPGGAFSTSTGGHPTGTFCWTPTNANIGHTYSFTASVHDDACPYFGSQTYAYTIHVIGMYVNAGLDQAIACSDLATLTAFASGGNGGPYTYLWSNGSTMQAITVGEGTYIVTATDGNCSATDTVNVTMPFIPVAAFTHTPPGCANIPIVFTDQSTTPGGILNYWHWEFGDGDTSNIQNPSHTYPGPGTYDVLLIVGNNLGCMDSITSQIVIGVPPVAEFTWGTACLNSAVSFTDQTTGSPNSWYWTFGDGAFSNQHNPSHTYTSTGNFTVTLISGNSSGCPDMVTHVITVLPLPVANAGGDQTTCAGKSVTLTATGGTSYSWSPGGQTSSTITIIPPGSTTAIVTVTDANGCSSKDTVNIIVMPLPTVNAGADQNVCTGSPVTLTATGAASYTWMPGGSTSSTIIVTPGSGTVYTVTGTGSNGCTATDAVAVSLLPLPTANAGPDKDICNGSSTVLTATGGGTYSWSPGGATSQSISVNPSSNQTYQVIVTGANGCSATDSVVVNIHSAPVINLASFFLCSGSTTTLDAGNPGSTYLWSTGATTQTISINSGGNYSVTVTNPYGCSDTASCNVSYGTSITVNLGNVSFCQGDSAVLDAGYSGLIYNWSPGGQTTQSITINSAGSYGVTVYDTSGCSGSINVVAVVNPLPATDFTVPSTCNGNATNFTDASTISSGTITNWNWDFGDSTISTNQNPSHTYASVNNYNVTLTTTSSSGCVSSVTHAASINPLPVADFSFTNSCPGVPIAFTNMSTVSSGSISSYNWTFGDGFTSTQQNPSHNFTAGGNYTVSLQVTTSAGCTQTVNHSLTIDPAPTASFTTSPVCLGGNTTFNNTSSIATGSIASVSWDFDDTFTSTQNSPTHTYTNSGTYAVRLIVTSSLGCNDTIINNVSVNGPPAANAGADQIICSGNSSNLTATGGVNYVWSPGGMTGSSVPVSPASTTTYSVTVTDANGCTASDAVQVNVNSLPVAQAGADQPLCSGNSVSLTGSGGISYNWSPGGMTTSVINVQPVSTTDYILTVTDANGCSNNDTVTVTVSNSPVVFAGPNNSICDGSTTLITATGATTYQWNPVGATTASVLVTPTSTTTYTVIGTNANGCSSSGMVTVFVRPIPVVNLNSAFICTGSNTQLNAGNPGSTYLWSTGETSQAIFVSDSGTYSVLVTGANGCPTFGSTNITRGGTFNTTPGYHFFCAGQSTNLDAGYAGSTFHWSTGQTTQNITVNTGGQFQVTITDTNGCAATIAHNVMVNPLPVAAFVMPSTCLGSPTSFNDDSWVSSGYIDNVSWEFGDSFNSTSPNAMHTYASAGSYNATLTVTSDAGCTSTITQQATIHGLPMASFSAPDECSGSPVHFTNQSISQDGIITSFLWGFGDGTYSFEANPLHVYADSGKYNVDLVTVSSYGCPGNFSDSVEIFSHPTTAITMNNACVGNVIQFNGSVDQNGPVTFQWDLGNGYTTTNPSFNYAYYTPGEYDVTLMAINSNGCTGMHTDHLSVYPSPVATFATNEVCQSSQTYFSNHSSITSGSIASYSWNFGDNIQSTSYNPSHVYPFPGTYNAVLSVVSDHGCVTSVVQPVNVHPNPTAVFAAGMQGCSPVNATFTETSSISSGTIAGYLWDFGDGNVSTDQHPQHFYNREGHYNVSLTVVSDFGCQNSYSASDAVYVFPQPTSDFDADPMVTDIQMPVVHFQNQSQNYWAYQWNFGDGTSTQSVLSPTHTFGDTGTYSAMLITVNEFGCRDTIMKTIEVKLHSTLFIANCFTPNGDGNNDDFRPYYTNMESIQVWIFDRWGKLLTTWDNLEGSWNGYYQGRKCQSDTYVYKIVGTGLDGKHSEWVGHVSIVY